MTTTQDNILVLKDQAVDYFLLPQELLERGRVPAEYTAAVERLVAESEDTHGHAVPLAIGFCAGFAGGFIVGSATKDDALIGHIIADYARRMGG